MQTMHPIHNPEPVVTVIDTTPAWQQAGAAWGHAAADWAYRFEPYATEAIRHVFDLCGVRTGIDLLDLACGSGYAAGIAERAGARVKGIDASAELIEIARRRAPGADLRAGDMFRLPWENGGVDVVTSFNGIWGGCDEALREARRVLRPHGRLGLTFWGPGHALDLRDWFIALGTSTPQVGEEMVAMADIGTPGVVEDMLTGAGFDHVHRTAATAVLEFPDDRAAWRAMRSPGLVVPALEALGEDELRARLMPALEPFRAPDGSYRLVNELTCVTARVAH